MFRSISTLKGVKTLTKKECTNINGGISECRRNCIQNFADCREDGNSHCFSSLRVCTSLC